jgi:prevent-host-death family protein
MGDVASRDLRNNTRSVLDRVAAGEEVTITVDGRPVAKLVPLDRRERFWKREEFIAEIIEHQADAELGRWLEKALPDTTDDVPIR